MKRVLNIIHAGKDAPDTAVEWSSCTYLKSQRDLAQEKTTKWISGLPLSPMQVEVMANNLENMWLNQKKSSFGSMFFGILLPN